MFSREGMGSDQKTEADCNHERFRGSLSKGRSGFDGSNVCDLATCASHAYFYSLTERGNRCLSLLFGCVRPQRVLDELGVVRITVNEVDLTLTS